jgi:sporulation protein YtfJ
MDKHPIENIMTTTMENIRDMVDVNTVIGDPVPTADGSTVIPVSRVSFGFASGGGEYGCADKSPAAQPALGMPFAGGSGAGVTVQPVGFLILSPGGAKLLPAQYATPVDHILESIPRLVSEIGSALKKPTSVS